MPKPPIEIVIEQFKLRIIREQKRNEFVYSQTDTFVTWLIGFAFAGLLVIVSDLKNINDQFSASVKSIIVSILVVIFFGIIFRFISFLIMTWERNLEEYYAILFTMDSIMPFEPNFDVESASIEKMVSKLQGDFGVDHSYALHIDETQKQIVLSKLKGIYMLHINDAKESVKRVSSFIAKVEYDTHRIPIKVNENAFDAAYRDGNSKEYGYHSKEWAVVRLVCFALTLLGFVVGVSIAGISLLL